ncbi:MAG: ESX secretion-associated protein EspG [Actinomycetota bacterium]|nr:ESX secretion-associated protein EspG [Actinomycetota bacterium]
MALDDWITLSELELDVVWRAERLGELPSVIAVPSPGRTHTERRDLEAVVWQDLMRQGLADSPGRIADPLLDRLVTVAHAPLRLELRAWCGYELRAILGRSGRRAAMVVLVGGDVRVLRVPDTRLAATIVSLLPVFPAGPGHSVTVDAASYAAAADEPEIRNGLVRRGLRRDDARTLTEMLADCTGYGQFAAEVSGRDGTVYRANRVVTSRDSVNGRYQLIRRITPTTDHITVTPADSAKVASTVDEILAELVRIHRS